MGSTWRGGGVSTSTITPRVTPEILAAVAAGDWQGFLSSVSVTVVAHRRAEVSSQRCITPHMSPVPFGCSLKVPKRSESNSVECVRVSVYAVSR